MTPLSSLGIPEVPPDWVRKPLKDLCEFKYGSSLPSSLRKPGPYPVYGSNGKVGMHSQALVKGPALVVGRKGSVGAVHFTQESFWPIDTTYYVDDHSHDVSLEWLKLVLETLGLRSLEKSTAIPGLSRKDLYDQIIPLPPLPEQKRIVAILNQQLAAVDRAKKASEERLGTAHDLRRVLLAETFHKGLTNDRVDLDRSRLGDVCEVVTGSTPSKANARFYGGNLPWVNPSHLGLTKYVSDSAEYLTEEGLRHARLVPGGAVLVVCISGSRDNLGKSSIAERPLTTNQQINSIIPGPNIDSEFLYYHLLALQPHLQQLAAHTNQNIVNKSKVLELPLYVPSLETQRRMASRLARMFKDVASLEDHFGEAPRHLRELSESLLHRAFSGEI